MGTAGTTVDAAAPADGEAEAAPLPAAVRLTDDVALTEPVPLPAAVRLTVPLAVGEPVLIGVGSRLWETEVATDGTGEVSAEAALMGVTRTTATDSDGDVDMVTDRVGDSVTDRDGAPGLELLAAAVPDSVDVGDAVIDRDAEAVSGALDVADGLSETASTGVKDADAEPTVVRVPVAVPG